MNNILFEVWVKDRLAFSDRDRRECFDTAHEIVNIAGEVRKNGLLTVDDKISAMSDKFMARAMQLAVDSTDPETLEKIMQTWIIYGNYSGAELLKRIVALDGVISLVNGENPLHIKTKLAAYFGEDLFEEFWGEIESKEKDIDITEFWNGFSDVQAEESEFGKIIMSMDNAAMQSLITNVVMPDIMIALKSAGTSKQVAESFLNNMGKKAAQQIMNEYMHLRQVRARDVTAAQERILAKIKELEERGEIVTAVE
jgi:hypothetical protein